MKLWNEIFVWTQQRVLNLIQYFSCFYSFVTYDVTLSGSPPQTSEILKRSFISTIPSPTVHTNPSPKRIFSKTLFKPEEFENGGVFVWTEYILKTELFESDDITIIIIIEFSSNTNLKWTDYCSVYYAGKHLCVCRVKPDVFKFFWRSVDDAHIVALLQA